MKRALLAVAVVGLVGASGAGAVAVDRYFYMHKGDRAEFVTPAHWSCLNRGAVVTCSSGDAFPYVDLTKTFNGGITVRVHMLGGGAPGHVLRLVDKFAHPMWEFSAL